MMMMMMIMVIIKHDIKNPHPTGRGFLRLLVKEA